MAASSNNPFANPMKGQLPSLILPLGAVGSCPHHPQQQIVAQRGYRTGGTKTMTAIAPLTTTGDIMPNSSGHLLSLARGIDKPGKNDILCGRGVSTAKHEGNAKFRELVGRNKELYVSSTKKGKMNISRSIVDIIRNKWEPPGRFLEMDKNSKTWFDAGDKKGIEKTSQALRDEAAELRKQLTADLDIVAMEDPEEEEDVSLITVDDDVVPVVNSKKPDVAPAKVDSNATVIPPNPVALNPDKVFSGKPPKQVPKKKKKDSVKHTRRVSGDQTVPEISAPRTAKSKTESPVVRGLTSQPWQEHGDRVGDFSLLSTSAHVASPPSAPAANFAVSHYACDDRFPNDFFTPSDDLSEEDGQMLGELFQDSSNSGWDKFSAPPDAIASQVLPNKGQGFFVASESSPPLGHDAPTLAPFSSQDPTAHCKQNIDHDSFSTNTSNSLSSSLSASSSSKQIVLVISEEQLKSGSLIYIPPQQQQTQEKVSVTSAPLICNAQHVQHAPPMYISQTVGSSDPMHNVQTLNSAQVQLVQVNGQAKAQEDQMSTQISYPMTSVSNHASIHDVQTQARSDVQTQTKLPLVHAQYQVIPPNPPIQASSPYSTFT